MLVEMFVHLAVSHKSQPKSQPNFKMLKIKCKHTIISKRKRKGLPCQFTTNRKLTSRNTKENVRFMVPDASGIQETLKECLE